MVQNHLLSQCHKIERWVYGCNNMSSATRYDKGFEAYVIYFGDDNKGYKITKYSRVSFKYKYHKMAYRKKK